MKFVMIISLIFFQLISYASPNYCQINPLTEIKAVNINTKASYFFRVFPNTDKVSFASQNANYILDLNTNALSKLPGNYDPVPLGEAVMSVPNKNQGMAYYSISEILGGNSTPEILYNSESMKGVYQSTGLISAGNGFEIYGVIAAGANDIQYQKIKVTYQPKLKVEPASEVLSLCQGRDIKMPMLSKTGQELSGFDVAAGVSKIWRLDTLTNTCIEVDNLGMFVAKADFSYDSKQLVFHLSANGFIYKLKEDKSGEIDWVESPAAEMSYSVFQYDRQTKILTKISATQPGSNAYYPVYQKDGSILYAVTEPSGQYRFELIRAHQIKPGKMALLNSADPTRVNAILAIGKLWSLTCYPAYSITSPETLALIALGLEQKKCLDLIRDQWNPDSHLNLIKSPDIISRPGGGIVYRRDLVERLKTRDLVNICQKLKSP
ncbi:MAG: hypothetical protein JNL11_05045 [Bdellovibrionaceae bacterium]|nr:hypothetical protein [Pseudobdellovibrionaceae bacterium]